MRRMSICFAAGLHVSTVSMARSLHSALSVSYVDCSCYSSHCNPNIQTWNAKSLTFAQTTSMTQDHMHWSKLRVSFLWTNRWQIAVSSVSWYQAASVQRCFIQKHCGNPCPSSRVQIKVCATTVWERCQLTTASLVRVIHPTSISCVLVWTELV